LDGAIAICMEQIGRIKEINTAGTAEIYACGDTSVGGDTAVSSRHASFEAGIIPSLEGICWSKDQR